MALGFLGRVCQGLSRGMSLVCQSRDSAGRWAFLGDSMGRSHKHKGLQRVLASVEHRQELAGRLGPTSCFSCVVCLYTEQHVCNNPCGSHHILHLKHTIWSNTLQSQHVFPVGVAFHSDTASSARAGTTLPRQVYISPILHQPWCGHCSGCH